jgi:hypothetical protein
VKRIVLNGEDGGKGVSIGKTDIFEFQQGHVGPGVKVPWSKVIFYWNGFERGKARSGSGDRLDSDSCTP